jgi:hypothetical protein
MTHGRAGSTNQQLIAVIDHAIPSSHLVWSGSRSGPVSRTWTGARRSLFHSIVAYGARRLVSR